MNKNVNVKRSILTDSELSTIINRYMELSKKHNTKLNAYLLSLVPYDIKILSIFDNYYKGDKINKGAVAKQWISKILTGVRTENKFYNLDLEQINFIKSLKLRNKIPHNMPPTGLKSEDIFNKFTDRKYTRKDKSYKAMYDWFINRDDVKGTEYTKVTYSILYRTLVKYNYKRTNEVPVRILVKQYLAEKYNSLQQDKDGVRYMYFTEIHSDFSEVKAISKHIPRKNTLKELNIKLIKNNDFVIEGLDDIFKAYHATKNILVLLPAFKVCNDEFKGYANVGQIANVIARNYSRIMGIEYTEKLRASVYDRATTESFKRMLETMGII